MSNLINVKLLFYVVLLMLPSPFVVAAEQESQFIGYAYDLKTGELHYQERHRRVIDASGSQVIYTDYVDAKNQVMAKRTVRSDGNSISEFELLDTVNRETLTVKRLEKKVILTQQFVNQLPDEVELKLSDGADNIIDAGFNDYVLTHWDALVSGEKKRFNFLSTERQSWIKFNVKSVGRREEESFTVHRFQMTLANPLIRFLMKPIKVDYYADSRELYRYQGISNLKRENGKNYSVRIEFPREDHQVLAQ